MPSSWAWDSTILGIKKRSEVKPDKIMTLPFPQILNGIEDSIRLADEAAKDAIKAAKEARQAGNKAASEAAEAAAQMVARVE